MAGDNQLPHSSAKHVSVRSAPACRRCAEVLCVYASRQTVRAEALNRTRRRPVGFFPPAFVVSGSVR
jgi:hypothetical protein